MQIITIDGPASSGKGTVARLIAKKLGFHYLESGAIYRVVALISIQASLNSLDIDKILALIDKMKLTFVVGRVFVANVDVTESLRAEEVGMMASLIAKNDVIRKRLLDFQRGFATTPGLVTDGRDMGSVVFPNANLKIFLTASSQIRANRRYEQLKEYNKNITLDNVLKGIIARDKQDTERSSAPLTYDSSFVLLDNANMSIEETARHIISLCKF
jgi:cytidylate kinase